MARYYRRRYRTIVRAPKKKWATNIVARTFTIDAQNPSPYISMVTNATQTSSPTPTILKCGNFKVNADFTLTYGQATDPPTLHIVAFILFLPEGIQPATNAQLGAVIQAHPEYIMAWKQVDTNLNFSGTTATNAGTQRVTFSSRLKRNLNSGDQVVFAVLDQTSGVSMRSIRVALTNQYWTCAN